LVRLLSNSTLQGIQFTASVIFKIQLPKRWRGRVVGGAALAFLGLCLYTLPFLQWFTHVSFDLLLALRPQIPVDEAVIVYMDEPSRKQLGLAPDGPWDRALHTKLLRELSRRSPKAVVLDILFSTNNPAQDPELANAIRDCGRVVLAFRTDYSRPRSEAGIVEPELPVEPIRSAAAWGLGLADLRKDTDETIRYHPYDPRYTVLAWKVAEGLKQAPENKAGPRWINYYGPPGSIPSLSYYQVLEPEAVPDPILSNKVVFVGENTPSTTSEGSRSTDECRTPYTRWTGFTSPGVEVHATVCLNLLRRDWLWRLSQLMEIGIILGAGLALAYWLPMVRSERLLVWGAVVAGAVAGGFLAAAAVFHLWFPWTIVSLAQAPGAVAWSFCRRPRQEAPETGAKTEAPTVQVTSSPQIPDHELVRPIGEGSYGQVWLAKSVIGTYRAVKVVYRNAFAQEAPFEREFRGIQNFEPISRSHEGFVDILHVGRNEQAGYFYYVMELADDQDSGRQVHPDSYVPKTLAKEVARRERIPLEECLSISISLSGALYRLHEGGFVHRDIKPANIIFVEGVPKLADIGLVAEAKSARSYVGTEGFLPPEGPGTPQADIYSLGKVLYEISMGRDRRLFPELPTHLDQDPHETELLELNEIILKACQNQVRLRYKTALRMHGDLVRLANQLSGKRHKKA
jgi:CHASE2 domain-containing sensor protein